MYYLKAEWQIQHSCQDYWTKLFSNTSAGPQYPLPDAATSAVPCFS